MKNQMKPSQDKFNQNIVNFVVNGLHPLSIVEEKGFIDLFNDFGVEVFSRRTLDRKINDYYMLSIDKLKYFLSQYQYICTTTDIWSMKDRSFIGVTAHVLSNKDFSRISTVLACTRFEGVHSYDRIADILHNIHLKYDLNISKIVATVTDNGSNFIKAFKEFGVNNDENELDETNENEDLQFVEVDENSDNNVQYSPLAYHQRCATHTLNLIASTDINKIIKDNATLKKLHHPALAKCTLLWNASRRPKTAETIFSILGFKLSYPCITRWNSLYDALCLILKDKEKLNVIFEAIGSIAQFKSYELDYLSDYIDILKPLSISLDKLQGEQNCYYGQLIPTLFSLKIKYEKMRLQPFKSMTITQSQHCSFMNDQRQIMTHQACLISGILASLEKRFKNYYELSPEVKPAILASMCHPTFKLKWLNLETPQSKKKSLCDLFINCAKTIESEHTHQTTSNSESDVDDFYVLPRYSNKDKDAEMGTEVLNSSKELLNSKIDIEILQFLEDKHKDFKSLNKFPHVKQLFLKYNVILPSSAAVERLFSFAGMINTPKRSCLSDKSFEKLVFLKGNQYFLNNY